MPLKSIPVSSFQMLNHKDSEILKQNTKQKTISGNRNENVFKRLYEIKEKKVALRCPDAYQLIRVTKKEKKNKTKYILKFTWVSLSYKMTNKATATIRKRKKKNVADIKWGALKVVHNYYNSTSLQHIQHKVVHNILPLAACKWPISFVIFFFFFHYSER